ncbi:MAG: alpha-mannosidase [Calditrichia bacterium]
MKTKSILILLIPMILFAQSEVDRLVEKLQEFSVHRLEGWKYSSEALLEGVPVEALCTPGYDDSQWHPLKFREHLDLDSCWFRTEFTLPEKIMGQPVSGELRFLISVDDYGYLWINGEEKGYFPWDGDFILTREAQPGMHFVLLVKMINTGGPGRLLRADLEPIKLRPLLKRIEKLSLSLRVAQKLLSFDTYQTNARVKIDPGIDRSRIDRQQKESLQEKLQSLAKEVRVDFLLNGSPQRFEQSVEQILPRLKEIDEFAKQFTLQFTSNAHIDAAWLWRKSETIEVCKNTFSSVLKMMETHPDFTYTQSSAVYYQWMEKLYPDIFRAIKKRVADGRWEIIGGTWVEPDCNLIDGVSWARQLLYGQRYFQNRFGKRVKIGWNPDSFGYNWNMPQFYQNAGIDTYITQKIGWNDTNVFPYRLFWWEGPEGSRILAYFPFDYINLVNNPFQLVDWLRQFEANTGLTKMMVLFGVGDHGGGPTPEMLERIEQLKDLYVYPRIEFGTASEYVEWLKSNNLRNLPVWNDELYLEYHRGTYTTQAQMKYYNRKSEVLLTNTEKFAAIASQYGLPYPRTDLEGAWQIVLFNQFHDILPGSSIREVHLDAREDYQKAMEMGEYRLREALRHLAKNLNTASLKGKPVVVYNPLNWIRNEVVALDLPEGDFQSYAIFTTEGSELPSQTITKNRYQRQILFKAEGIPSLGYKVFELRPQSSQPFKSELKITPYVLENRFFRIEVDSTTGWLRSIFDKQNKRELLDGPGNELQIFEDKPSAWDAWNIGLGKRFASKFRKTEIVETGPIRSILRIYHDYLSPYVSKRFPAAEFPNSFFMQDIILLNDTPRIDFVTHADWWEEHTMLKVAFPLTIQSDWATYEIPYATIRRPTRLTEAKDKGKWEVPALRWADLSDGNYGVSLLNDSKYGYDIKENTMRLSLLRSPNWPDPTADRGKHIIRYALYPHKEDWRQAHSVRRGYEFNSPLIGFIAEKANGNLPPENSFLDLQPENLILTSLKIAEDAPQSWIIQLYECKGEETVARLTLPRKPKEAYFANFLEEPLKPLKIQGETVQFSVEKNKVITLKIGF